VNIGNPQEITILEFAERIRKHFDNARPSYSSRCRRRSQARARHHKKQHLELGAKVGLDKD